MVIVILAIEQNGMAQIIFAYIYGHCQILIKSKNNIIFLLKLTLLLIVLLAKYRFYRPFAGNTDLLKTQKCKIVCITDPLGNPGTTQVYRCS